MMNDLYNQRILQLAADIPHIGHLDAPAAKADAASRLCGSTVHVELALGADGRVSDFAQIVEACALGQASSSVMAREIIGNAAELRDLAAAIAMLKQAAPPPHWPGLMRGDLQVLEPVRDLPIATPQPC